MSVLLMMSTTLLTAFSLVREKEGGTLEQLFVTPVRPLGLLLGKITPYFGIGLLEFSFMLIGTRFIFGVPIHGRVLLLVLLTLPYLFTNLAIGILISSKAETQPRLCSSPSRSYCLPSSSPVTSFRGRPCHSFFMA